MRLAGCQAKKRKATFDGRTQSTSSSQNCIHCVTLRQPTLVVARVGTCWHASAHKGCPVFPRWAPELNTIAEADYRYCLVEATVVIRHSDQVEHKSGMKFRRKRRLRTQGVRPTCPERFGLGSPLAMILRHYSREGGITSSQWAIPHKPLH